MSGEPSKSMQEAPSSNRGTFSTTHWSVILSARDSASPESESSLEALCQAYWYPVYAHVRRQGHNPHDSQDLTQDFFSSLVHKNFLNAADREKGRFRTFLIVALQRFLANDWDRSRAKKRGGGQILLSLDAEEAEQRYLSEPASDQPPERVYDRRWALTILSRTMASLRAEFEEAGKGVEFEQLKVFLTADVSTPTYAALAAQLGVSEGAARVAVHRIRKQFREVFRREISQVIASAGDIDDEIRYLLSVLADQSS